MVEELFDQKGLPDEVTFALYEEMNDDVVNIEDIWTMVVELLDQSGETDDVKCSVDEESLMGVVETVGEAWNIEVG